MSQIDKNRDELIRLRRELIKALNINNVEEVTRLRSKMNEIKVQQEKLVGIEETLPDVPYPTERSPVLHKQPEVDTPVSVDTSPHESTHP